MITEGDRAPDFTLPGSSPQGGIEEYSLEEACKDGPVIMNFYVFDFHPACTDHLCDLNNLSWFDIRDDVTVLGVSSDRSFSHQAFAREQDLDFPLLSDSDGSVAETFGVLYEEYQGHKRIAKRSVFVIDSEQIVRYAWCTEDPSTHPDWKVVEEAVSSLDRTNAVS